MFFSPNFHTVLGLLQYNNKKISIVQTLPHPTTVKELQQFPGFYQLFFRGFSHIITPLTLSLHSPHSSEKCQRLPWFSVATLAILMLKVTFSSAPIFWHLDPEHHFCCGGCFVGLTTGVEAILSVMALLLSDFLVPASPKSQLWQHQPGALVHQAGPGGVAPLARQFLFPLPGDSRSVQLGVPQILFRFHTCSLGAHIIQWPISSKVDALSRLYSQHVPESILPHFTVVIPIHWTLDDQTDQASSIEPVPALHPLGSVSCMLQTHATAYQY